MLQPAAKYEGCIILTVGLTFKFTWQIKGSNDLMTQATRAL